MGKSFKFYSDCPGFWFAFFSRILTLVQPAQRIKDHELPRFYEGMIPELLERSSYSQEK
jgi:hypothetical protein